LKSYARAVIFSLWVLSTVLVIPLAVGEDPKGNISFQPNIIPELQIHFVEEFFRFKWLSNTFDLKLLINCEGKNLSLRDFWETTDRLVKWKQLKNKATESMYEFGYMIEDIPQEIADNVEYLVWKIEGANFDVDEIEVEEIEVFEEGYNITRFHLPDNLVLSYEDLWLYDFTVSHPNKLDTIVKGVKGKSSWNLDPITFSSNIITTIGGTEGTPLDFDDLWVADKAGTHDIVERTGIIGNDADYVAVNDTLRPADIRQLGTFGNDDLWFYVTNWQNMNSCVIRVRGTNLKGDSITDEYLLEDYNFPTGIGTYYLGGYGFHTITYTKVASWNGTGGFDYDLTQGQWGVVWKTGDTQYIFDAKIILGNGTEAGTTWFADTEKQVYFTLNVLSGNTQNYIELKNYAHLTFGTLEDLTSKSTSSGVQIIVNADVNTRYSYVIKSAVYIELYSSHFIAIGTQKHIHYYRRIMAPSNSRIWNCVLDNVVLSVSTVNLFNVIIKNGYYAFEIVTGIIDGIYIANCYIAVKPQTSWAMSITGLYGRASTYALNPTAISTDKYLINPDLDSWNILWTGTSTAEVYRQYEFDLTVTYPNGTAIQNANVTVKHYGQAESQDFTELTDSNGQIATKTLSMGFYNQTGADTIYNYNPHNITITYSGMQTYTKNFTLADQTEWTIALQEESAAGYNWFAATIIIGLFACFMTIYALTGKT